MTKKNSAKIQGIVQDSSVKTKYYQGGQWKARKAQKASPHGHRKCPATHGKAGKYVAIPPEGGWIGGDPVKNGYKVNSVS